MKTLTERGVSGALLDKLCLLSGAGFGCACGVESLRRLLAVLATGHAITPRLAYRLGLADLPRHIRALETIGLVFERVHVPRHEGGGRKQRGYVLIGAQSASLTIWSELEHHALARHCSDACRHYAHLRSGGLQ